MERKLARSIAGSSSSRRSDWRQSMRRPKAQVARSAGHTGQPAAQLAPEFEREEPQARRHVWEQSWTAIWSGCDSRRALKSENELLKKAAIYFARQSV